LLLLLHGLLLVLRWWLAVIGIRGTGGSGVCFVGFVFLVEED
jgi:hypothetical protein